MGKTHADVGGDHSIAVTRGHALLADAVSASPAGSLLLPPLLAAGLVFFAISAATPPGIPNPILIAATLAILVSPVFFQGWSSYLRVLPSRLVDSDPELAAEISKGLLDTQWAQGAFDSHRVTLAMAAIHLDQLDAAEEWIAEMDEACPAVPLDQLHFGIVTANILYSKGKYSEGLEIEDCIVDHARAAGYRDSQWHRVRLVEIYFASGNSQEARKRGTQLLKEELRPVDRTRIRLLSWIAAHEAADPSAEDLGADTVVRLLRECDPYENYWGRLLCAANYGCKWDLATAIYAKLPPSRQEEDGKAFLWFCGALVPSIASGKDPRELQVSPEAFWTAPYFARARVFLHLAGFAGAESVEGLEMDAIGITLLMALAVGTPDRALPWLERLTRNADDYHLPEKDVYSIVFAASYRLGLQRHYDASNLLLESLLKQELPDKTRSLASNNRAWNELADEGDPEHALGLAKIAQELNPEDEYVIGTLTCARVLCGIIQDDTASLLGKARGRVQNDNDIAVVERCIRLARGDGTR